MERTSSSSAPADPAAPGSLDEMSVEELSINTIRTLAMDAVQAADSGHPGTPMALAPLGYTLFTRHLRYNPDDPEWFDRDRFVLSAGHASMLQYALLHLVGYDLPLEEIRDFRQWGSRTPGHPEAHLTPGVETTTGPLGQGIMNSVGMAMAEARLADRYNRDGFPVVDHRTYAICSDGDLMEGASHEAASVAGHFGLGKLIWVYDDNHISIDGDTGLTYSDDVPARFESYGWHVQDLGESANDVESLSRALQRAEDEEERPSLITIRSHIAWGAPNKQDTAEAHGSPLGDEEVRDTKRRYGWPEDETFLVPDRARRHMREAGARGGELQEEWDEMMAAYREEHPEAARELAAARSGDLPDGWDADVPSFSPEDGPTATRNASGEVLRAIAPRVPWLMGGSADLTGSNRTELPESGPFGREDYDRRNIHWGVREHVMCAASSGMSLHGGIRPYAASFLIFTDYARPAIRLASLMELPVIYVMTHDSIGLGEDGPTHQPVEHLASLRAVPHLAVLRPGDANEVAEAWKVAVRRTEGPTLMALTRQGVPILDRSELADAPALRRGAYVLRPEEGERPDVILIATGSEVPVAVEAADLLAGDGIDPRVVSMPSWELFREQPEEYRASVLPPGVTARVSVEAGATQGWEEWIGPGGRAVGLDRFGSSAPGGENMRRFGFTPENVAENAREVLES